MNCFLVSDIPTSAPDETSLLQASCVQNPLPDGRVSFHQVFVATLPRHELSFHSNKRRTRTNVGNSLLRDASVSKPKQFHFRLPQPMRIEQLTILLVGALY